MRVSILRAAVLLALATLSAPAQEQVMLSPTGSGEEREAVSRRLWRRCRVEWSGGMHRLATAQKTVPVWRGEAGPRAAIVVVDPADDAASEIAMTVQTALESAGESGLPRWQEPAEVYLCELGVAVEIGGDAGRYSQWLRGDIGDVPFQWSAGNGVLRYYLFAGSWLGGDNLYSQDH